MLFSTEGEIYLSFGINITNVDTTSMVKQHFISLPDGTYGHVVFVGSLVLHERFHDEIFHNTLNTIDLNL